MEQLTNLLQANPNLGLYSIILTTLILLAYAVYFIIKKTNEVKEKLSLNTEALDKTRLSYSKLNEASVALRYIRTKEDIFLLEKEAKDIKALHTKVKNDYLDFIGERAYIKNCPCCEERITALKKCSVCKLLDCICEPDTKDNDNSPAP